MKKNYYKKILTYALIILLISMAIAPSINASITKKSTTVEEREIAGFGSIYGSTHYLLGWGVYELPFTLVVAESEGTSRQDRSNIFSNYRINSLPLDKTYTVTASSNRIIEQQGKYYELVSESRTVTLTENEPSIELNFALKTNQVESVHVDKTKVISNSAELNNEKTGNYGRVTGDVTIHCFPPPTYIVGAKLVLEGDNIKKTTYSGLLGRYRFNFVEIGKQYTLTVTHPKFKTVTETFTLSADDPNLWIDIAMMDKDNARNTNYEEPACLGSIYGNTGIGYIWGFSPVRFVKVSAGGKTTISSPFMGEYRIRGLPLGTYTITGVKKGYETFTDTVTLTENYPDKQVFVDMEPNDESVEKTSDVINIVNTINYEPACFGTIIGKTGAYSWSGWGPVNNVKVTIGSRTKYSKPHFFFTGLALGQTYTVTASKTGWKTQTKEVTLSEDNPIANIQFDLDNDDDNTKTYKNYNFGLIYGHTMWVENWSGGPIWFAKIKAQGENYHRVKRSNIFGVYFLLLPLNVEISITASKAGYETVTKTVTLTEKNRIENLSFTLNEL